MPTESTARVASVKAAKYTAFNKPHLFSILSTDAHSKFAAIWTAFKTADLCAYK